MRFLLTLIALGLGIAALVVALTYTNSSTTVVTVHPQDTRAICKLIKALNIPLPAYKTELGVKYWGLLYGYDQTQKNNITQLSRDLHCR